jgi:hypothetical protein
MSYETNLLKENNELKREVKNLSNKLERCYNSKVTFEHMLKTQRNFGDKSDLGFNQSKKNMTKGERKRERKMKKLAREKLFHFMCYRCYEVGSSSPNMPQLREAQVEERRRKDQTQVIQVPYMGSLHLNVPKQETSEATRRASTKATR